MPNKTENALVMCPYYLDIGSDGRTVICEGLIPESRVKISFAIGEAYDDWLKKACQTLHYENHCMVARLLDAKYSCEQPTGCGGTVTAACQRCIRPNNGAAANAGAGASGPPGGL